MKSFRSHTLLRGVSFLHECGSSLNYCVYPPFCLVCEGDVTAAEHLVCEGCWSSLEIIDRPFCSRCGASLSSEHRRCVGCAGKKFSFSGGRSVYSYSENVRKIIYAFKFQRKMSLAKRLGRTLAFVLVQDERLRDADCIIPVPLHVSRQRERGYNQSEILAGEVCTQLGMTLVTKALIRRRRTRAQTTLSPRRRERNVEQAFAVVDPSDIHHKKVILVDDVFTTGSTVDACAQALREAGAVDVTVLTVTRAS